MKKTTRIFSNDPTDSIIQISIQADVKAEPYSDFPVQVSPMIVDLSPEEVEENSEIEVNVKNATSDGLDIEIVDMPSDYIKGELSSKLVKPSEEVKLKVKLKREAEDTKLTKSITLQLSDQDSSRFTVPVSSQRLLDEH